MAITQQILAAHMAAWSAMAFFMLATIAVMACIASMMVIAVTWLCVQMPLMLMAKAGQHNRLVNHQLLSQLQFAANLLFDSMG